MVVFALLGGGCKASKADWIEKFEPATVDALCMPNMYFRKCFDTDEAGCKSLAKRTVHACLDQHMSEIPDTLDTEDGRRLGGEVGECAGDAYYDDMLRNKKLVTTDKCKDPSAWIPK